MSTVLNGKRKTVLSKHSCKFNKNSNVIQFKINMKLVCQLKEGKQQFIRISYKIYYNSKFQSKLMCINC